MDVFCEMYVVAVCYKCGQLLLATSTQKTRCCPHCSARLSMIKVRRVVQVRTAQEASNYIRALKQKDGSGV
ncbi:MAG: DUF1922 domain-containing protein [Candidatus Bathyarchaeia archaeon]